MIEYYLLKCGCLMTCEKMGNGQYHYRVVLPRCVQSRLEKTDYMSETSPDEDGYKAKLLTKFEASVEIMQG
jgi:hypothetical protein